jgi:hypothetical protein
LKLSEEELRQIKEDLIKAKLEKLARLEQEIELKARFPHRHSMKFYPWQREWLECRDKIQCLTAANQCGKSHTMMVKTIEWITNKDLWPDLWPNSTPRSAWYLYPTKDMALTEFNEKWRQMLPPENDPEFGWTFVKGDKGSALLSFPNIPFDLHFKTYAQGSTLLQASTCSFIICDEELPEDLVPELQARVSSTDGYIVFGFTATIGQAFWKSVVEERVIWPDAWVRQISLYDCMYYEDGTPSPWTKDRIKARIDQCTTKAEVQRRVFGKFVRDEGLRFPHFDRDVHLAEVHPVPKNWEVYCGVDWGSGGERGHPSAICFTAVSPNYREARVIRFWRGDKISTTAEDLIDMWLEMKSTIPNEITATYYDFSAADIGTIAGRRGLPWLKADKGRDSGNAIVSSLLKSKAIKFYIPSDSTNVPHHYLESFKLAQEFESLGVNVNKSGDRDDGIDACFVAGTMISTATGPMPIELVKSGDLVWTRAGLRRVLDSGITSASSDVLSYEFSNGNIITATPSHRVMTNLGWQMLSDIHIGDYVLSELEWCRLSAVKKAGKAPVYNLTVEDVPEYFANGILAHNCRYSISKVPFQIQSRGDSYTLEPEKRQDVYFSAASSRTNPEALKVWGNNDGIIDVEEEFDLWNSILEG